MRSRPRLLTFVALATLAAGATGIPDAVAQVMRCWDVVCTIDAEGKMRCIEKEKPCLAEVT